MNRVVQRDTLYRTNHHITIKDVEISFDVHRDKCVFRDLKHYYSSTEHDNWLEKFYFMKSDPLASEETRMKQNTDFFLFFYLDKLFGKMCSY